MSNRLDPDHAPSFVGPDCGSYVCKCYEQTTLEVNELKLYQVTILIRAPPMELYFFGLSIHLSVCLSNCPLLWPLSLKILIGSLSDFIYGLLPSNSGASSNKGFVRLTVTQMADKMATAYQFAVVDTLH